MSHDECLTGLRNAKIVAIVRGVALEKMLDTAGALAAGGISCLEITFDHRSQQGRRDTLRGIEVVSRTFPELLIGAGTVLTTRDVEEARDAGARYMISPNTEPDVIARTRELGLVSMPGAFTPSEVVQAFAAGGDIIKFFPAALLGIPYIKALRGPLAHIPMAAVGGVTPENLGEFLRAGVCAAGIGGSLVDLKAISAGEYGRLTETARRFTLALNNA